MTIVPQNRMAQPESRKQGRPPASDHKPESQPVSPNTAALQVLADACPPCCGRAQDRAPRIERGWRTVDGGIKVADCVCPMCGKRYTYVPAQKQAKH